MQVPMIVGTAEAGASMSHLAADVLCTGDVPYIICLDRSTRSLVLSIRGTQSLADAATDLLAYPYPLHQWLPATDHQACSYAVRATPRQFAAQHSPPACVMMKL